MLEHRDYVDPFGTDRRDLAEIRTGTDDDLGEQTVCEEEEEETALRYLLGIATDLGAGYAAGRVNPLEQLVVIVPHSATASLTTF